MLYIGLGLYYRYSGRSIDIAVTTEVITPIVTVAKSQFGGICGGRITEQSKQSTVRVPHRPTLMNFNEFRYIFMENAGLTVSRKGRQFSVAYP